MKETRKRDAIITGLLAAGFILGLTVLFFAGNRYVVFLYTHMGAGPFDPVTRGRYWMTGLVIAGYWMIVYTMYAFARGRLSRGAYTPPRWWAVWSWSAIPIAIGVPLITLTVNEPVMPADIALYVTLMTLAGLALGLLPAEMAAKQPGDLLWLALNSAGPVAVLATFYFFFQELPGGLNRFRCLYAVGGWVGGLLWLLIMTAVRQWRGKGQPGFMPVMLAGLIAAYGLFPPVHHFFSGYITAAENSFAKTWAPQLATFAAAALVVWIAALVRERRPLPLVPSPLAGKGGAYAPDRGQSCSSPPIP